MTRYWEDTDLLYTGALQLPDDFWEKHGKDMKSWQKESHTYYQIKGPLCGAFFSSINSSIRKNGTPFMPWGWNRNEHTALLRTLTDYTHTKHSIWGINARNREQSFVLNLLLDPEIGLWSPCWDRPAPEKRC